MFNYSTAASQGAEERTVHRNMGMETFFLCRSGRGDLAQHIYWEHCYTTGLILATGRKKRTKLSFVLSAKSGAKHKFLERFLNCGRL